MTMETHGASDTGCQRGDNEDRILLDPALGLYVVCDGMGGHNNGGMAAEIAIGAIRYYVDASSDRLDVTWPFGYDYRMSIDANRIATAIRVANRQVWRRAEQDAGCAGMGTTVAAVLVSGGAAAVANVGDSRVYRFRGGRMDALTVDDSVVRAMFEQGLIDAAQMQEHPMRNVLTQAAGSHEEIEVHLREEQLAEGDVLLICSDGLHGVVSANGIAAIVAAQDSVERRTHRLVDAARAAGGPDNISAILLAWAA